MLSNQLFRDRVAYLCAFRDISRRRMSRKIQAVCINNLRMDLQHLKVVFCFWKMRYRPRHTAGKKYVRKCSIRFLCNSSENGVKWSISSSNCQYRKSPIASRNSRNVIGKTFNKLSFPTGYAPAPDSLTLNNDPAAARWKDGISSRKYLRALGARFEPSIPSNITRSV